MAGEYTGEVVLTGMAQLRRSVSVAIAASQRTRRQRRRSSSAAVPARPPGFCVGCPERPVFSAMKLLEKETGEFHVSADIGCHTFSTLPPFNIGNTVLGYGLGLASNSAVHPMFGKRTVTIMGDGGFWHNGLTSGDRQRRVQQGRRHPRHHEERLQLGHRHAGAALLAAAQRTQIPRHVDRAGAQGLGVDWMRTVHTYHVGEMKKTLKDAMTTAYQGLKVIIADGECQLERQRRIRPVTAKQARRRQARGAREVRRGRGRLHRRPLLHPALGLPHAHRQGQPRSAAGGPGRHGDRGLRGLRPVRRERARGDAVPVLLPRRGDPERERLHGRIRRAWRGDRPQAA